MILPKDALVFVLLVSTQVVDAVGLCKKWERLPNLPGVSATALHESSGLSSSISFPNKRYYHINDSGTGSQFLVSYLNKGLQRLEISRVDQYEAEDLESIDVAACPQKISGSCLYLADIGNNELDRRNFKILVVGENKNYQKRTEARLVINADYEPDPNNRKLHNAEAMMIDPRRGDIYIVTKGSGHKTDGSHAADARVYVLRRSEYENATGEIFVSFKYLRLLRPSEIFTDFQIVRTAKDKIQKVLVTDADFSPDGSRFTLLFKGAIVEFDSKVLLSRTALAPSDFSLSLEEVAPVLDQQEAVTYTSDGEALIYTSELKKGSGLKETELLRLRCVDR